MTHYLLFSGGLDSVLLLHDLMEKLKKQKTDHILILYVNASFTINKQPKEIIAVEKSLSWMKNKYPDEWRRVNCRSIELHINGGLRPYIIGLQSFYWFPAIMCYINIDDDATLYTTTVIDDESTIALEEFERCFQMLHEKARMIERYSHQTTHSFQFAHPFLSLRKETIIERFVDTMPELFYDCVSCEDSSQNFCKSCPKCREIIAGSIIAITQNIIDKPNVSNFLIDFLAKYYGIQYNPIKNNDQLTIPSAWTDYFTDYFKSTRRDDERFEDIIDRMREYYCANAKSLCDLNSKDEDGDYSFNIDGLWGTDQ